MTLVQEFAIPGLATVKLDTRNNQCPNLEIVLDPQYRGDLNDIARETPGPDQVYLRCDDASAINNPDLARFMEVMTHWDYTGDGRPDCDAIIDAIEEALWQSRDKPEEFHRPGQNWFERLCMSFMPPAPDRHIVYSFGELRPRFRWYHHAAALPMLALFFGLIQLEDAVLPVMKYSVVTGFMAAAENFGVAWWVALIVFVVLIRSIGRKRNGYAPTMSKHTYGFFNKAALYEEQVWREGSENWTTAQRIRSCFSFGLVHLANLIYPLATILPLALGGGLFMLVYLRVFRETRFRRSAVLASTVWHRVYNRVALVALAASLTIWLGLQLLGVIAVFAVLLGLGPVRDRYVTRRAGRLAPAPEGASSN